MSLLTVLVLYDKDLNFFPSGRQFTIPSESQIGGTKTLPTAARIPGAVDYVPESPLLTIKTLEFGNLYVNMTLNQYLQAVAATYASAGAPEMTLTLSVPADTPAGTTVTSPLLKGGTINAIFISGIPVDIRLTTLVNSGANGVLTLGAGIVPLVDTDWISILYYKN